MTLNQYIDKLNSRYKSGIATEHTFRGDLQQLIETISPEIAATNEPKRQACGAPDYVITKKEIPIGYIEAKDIGADLNSKAYKQQFDRYKTSLHNLIITDYIDFHLYVDGELKTTIKIGEIQGGAIVHLAENFDTFTNLIKDFCTHIGQTIKSSKKLAEMMAGKARMLAQVIEKAITSDEEKKENSTLKEQMHAFKEILIHDITPKAFADIYSQTIAYGMFAARLHDETLDDFSRQEAANLIPKSNPFLRKLFQYISGYDIDSRIEWIVAALADIFRATDVNGLLHNFGKATQTHDPIIHFYETFLAEYDPKLRKARGVWYTPEPVVNFIVRAVDDILKIEFDLPQGLADTSKTKVKVKTVTKATADRRSNLKEVESIQEVHKVQLLDPATGTGTFLAEVVKHIYRKFEGQQGIWSQYVEKHLMPRLNGFELLMASYAMAHLKLDLLLTETGFKPSTEQRLRVYLTNSLEESHPDTGTLFAHWLSTEANEANHIKRDTPVMVVLGNPPYSGESANKGKWIMDLMEDYKKEPGGKLKLKERNPKMVNDDYVKFIRYGQYFIEKNGEGILAFINPHGYLDNPTFRGMRWNLLKTYDKIYTIDLHGNSKKKETAPDGSKDENVFDIMQGVSINLFIKTGNKKPNTLAEVYHYDLFGKRDEKYKFLWENSLKTILFKNLENRKPSYFMTPKNYDGFSYYMKGIKLNELFKVNTSGIKTHRDNFVIDFEKESLRERINKFYDKSYTNEFILNKYELKAKEEWLQNTREGNYDNSKIKIIYYRPFDLRWIYYSNDLVDRGRENVFNVSLFDDNLAILSCRQQSTFDFQHILLSKNLTDMCAVSLQTKETGYYFPLYLYQEKSKQTRTDNGQERIPNFNKDIVKEIVTKLDLQFVREKEDNTNTFAPIDLIDYIYAVLHNPTYRETYKEFLKIDFPRVPYPTNQDSFWKLVKLGGELRKIHLLESTKVEQFITTYPKEGDNVVTRKMTKNSIGFESTNKKLGKVWINDNQYFDNVPQIAWEFYIGGYQPAQKWLKDRVGRTLSYEDIQHYQKIIVALSETDRIMKEIDKIQIIVKE
jgi:predicted helicase